LPSVSDKRGIGEIRNIAGTGCARPKPDLENVENTNASGGDFKFTFCGLAMVAMGVSSGLRVQPASPR
jgi:hypothetical protein